MPVASRRIHRHWYALMSGTAHLIESQDGTYRFGFRGEQGAGRLVAGPEATSRRTPCWRWSEGKENPFAGSRGLLEGEVCLLLHHTTSVLGVLPTHGPRTISGAFGVGFDGIELAIP